MTRRGQEKLEGLHKRYQHGHWYVTAGCKYAENETETNCTLASPQNAEQSPQRSLLAAHLGTVLRLAHECPFNDVRDHFRHLLESLPAEVAVPRRVWSGPSRFMPAFTPVPMGDAPGREREAELYREMFFHDGRCSHMVQLMMCFPEYLEAFIRTLHFVMRCDGPLPLAWRTYVAIMVCSALCG
jgi:hypothetical protein